MGLFSKKKPEPVVEPVREPTPPPPNPFPDAAPRYNPYAEQETFVPQGYRSTQPQSRDAAAAVDPLAAAAQRKKERDDAILDAIFHAFARVLPTYGSKMKKYMQLTTSDYAFNEGEYSDRYKDLERQIEVHMERKGWKVKHFHIRNGKERSKSTLNKYYPEVKWEVMEPGTFKPKK